MESNQTTRMLLHACCGPCSLEPLRCLQEEGVEPVIFYMNSNIESEGEYARRLDTLKVWAQEEGISVEEGAYDPDSWREDISDGWDEHADPREERCRICYRHRFEASAEYAKSKGFGVLCTTLSISPYQHTELIREELERACEMFGLECRFVDWRPYYQRATQRSREAGMYRQDYCGCALSKVEADVERAQRAELRAKKKAERAKKNKEEESKLQRKRQERQAYDDKRAKQRAILKGLRAQRSQHEDV